VYRGFYYHHGIFVNDLEVIHYNTHGEGDGLLGNAMIISTTLKEFLDWGTCEVKVYKKPIIGELFNPEEVIKRARSRIGKADFNLLFNNCEHFASWCKIGYHRSKQVEAIAIKIVKTIAEKRKKRKKKP